MLLAYNAILIALLPVALPLALLVALAIPRLRRGLAQRFRPLEPMDPGGVWLHAASVGEAEAAAPLLEALRERGTPICVTTMTATGRDRLLSRLPQLRVRLAPLDLPGLVHLSVRRVRPRTLVLVETELWPNLIGAVASAGGRVGVVSGRISERSFRRYRLARPLFASVLRRVSWVGAQSEADRDRFVALGLPAENAEVSGDLKLDRPAPAPPGPELREALGSGPFLVCGSTHAGEEAMLLAAWRKLRDGPAPGLRLLLAPRHPERVPDVLREVSGAGARAALRSAGAASAEVVVLDTLGELGAVYTLADLVFVGGSLVPLGGHNLLEPVRAGKVVVHGPHTEYQRAQLALLDPLQVLRRVADETELAATLAALLRDPERHAAAAAARVVLDAHGGAVPRALERVLAGDA